MGTFCFIYNSEKLKSPPTSFEELSDDKNSLSLIIQDPRTSTPGLGLLLWVKSIFKENSDKIWERLSPKIVTVTKGWSEAYGLFLEGEADLVLSYTTSPAYHIMAEEEKNIKRQFLMRVIIFRLKLRQLLQKVKKINFQETL